MQYPLYSDNGPEEYNDQKSSESSCKTLIVFMVGGVTYEEAKEIAQFGKVTADQQKPAPQGQLQQIAGSAQQMAGSALSNLGTQSQNQNLDIILGGTYIHNSKTFLADVSQLKDSGAANKMHHFEIE